MAACPLTDEWIKKMWYIYTMEYYSAVKKSEVMPFAATWMDLELIILSEVRQVEKDKYHITYLWNLKKRSRLTDAFSFCRSFPLGTEAF